MYRICMCVDTYCMYIHVINSSELLRISVVSKKRVVWGGMGVGMGMGVVIKNKRVTIGISVSVVLCLAIQPIESDEMNLAVSSVCLLFAPAGQYWRSIELRFGDSVRKYCGSKAILSLYPDICIICTHSNFRMYVCNVWYFRRGVQ